MNEVDISWFYWNRQSEHPKSEGAAIVICGYRFGLTQRPATSAGKVCELPSWAYGICLLALLLAGCSPESPPRSRGAQSVLKLAVTSSTRDSGLLDVLVPIFEARSGARVDLIAVGTGAALKLGAAGDVDVVLVHARQAENAFMSAGHGVRREDVMYNMFGILGPQDDPASIRDMEPEEALAAIALSGERFISRGDDSGTHKREQQLWGGAQQRPRWAGYMESGQGMGATLTIADQMNAYVLSDRGTFLRFKQKLSCVPLVTSANSLRNPYGIIVIDPRKHSLIKHQLAQTFVDFMISAEAQKVIQNYTIEDEQLFYPLHPSEEN